MSLIELYNIIFPKRKFKLKKKTMRYIQNILFLIIILSFSLILSQDATDDVIINRISNDPVEGQGDQTSSMAGGALFYIRGSGFDQMVSNNLVFMGPYQANVIGLNINAFI